MPLIDAHNHLNANMSAETLIESDAARRG